MAKSLLLMGLAPAAAAGLLAVGGCADDYHRHRVHEEVVVARPAPRVVEEREIVVEGDGARPAPYREVIVERPYRSAVWHDGHWERRDHRWVWVRGYWR